LTIPLQDALAECRRLRMDLTNAQAKLTDVITALAAHPDSEAPRPKCPSCGSSFRGDRSLAEHVYNAHAGPVPQHFLDIEARVDEYAPAVVDEEGLAA
jgi:hypothetical protein